MTTPPAPLVADLHIHSHYSRATSKTLDFEHLTLWAQRKGVHLLATGDIAHPGWLEEMRNKLEPVDGDLFRLKPEHARAVDAEVPAACRGEVRFILGGEISNIYKKHGRTRKVHNMIYAPTLDAVAQIQIELEKIGNIRSDGRPILGLDSRDLFEIVLNVDERCQLIPAHIWTPWFSMLGSKSGFDRVRDCFDDLTERIYAVETGLSSDPPMNWRVSMLDDYTLVSSSDAHSPPKLAREATLFGIEPSYDALFDALRTGNPQQVLGTIEFFPEEGKYHMDGHRKCGVCWHPRTSIEHDGICSECGKPVVLGVMHRVEALADHDEGRRSPRARPFHSLIPLPEILGEVLSVGAGSKRVARAYERLLAQLGPELNILMRTSLEAIAEAGGERLARGIDHMRRGHVIATPGFDGEFGVIHVLDARLDAQDEQSGLFGTEQLDAMAVNASAEPPAEAAVSNAPDAAPDVAPDVAPNAALSGASLPRALRESAGGALPSTGGGVEARAEPVETVHPLLAGLNEQQREAAACVDSSLLLVAGPGTGKTRTLTRRLAYLVETGRAKPSEIVAITFTHKAANEMRERMEALLGARARQMTIATFHAFGAEIMREWGGRLDLSDSFGNDFTVLDEEAREALLSHCLADASAAERRALGEQISAFKSIPPGEGHAPPSDDVARAAAAYESALRAQNAVDFDDLIALPLRLFAEHPDALAALHARLHWIAVDEYQDVNAAQVQLLRQLTAGGANLCAIGDPDQAIYGFRGADRRYFLRFTEDYPDARVLHLTQNYRSTQSIIDAAQQVIEQSGDRTDGGTDDRNEALRVWSEFATQTKLTVFRAPTDRAEAEFVVHSIEQMVGGTSYFSIDSGRVDDREEAVERTFGDFAVLYRTHALSRPLLEAFERSGIPFQVAQKQQPEAETNAYDERADRVALLSLHASKGLEFPVVFIVGCEETLLPYVRPGGKEKEEVDVEVDVEVNTEVDTEIEEERRLFYVGMTRAQERLILSHADKRFVYGQQQRNAPSRFVTDIEAALKELEATRGRPQRTKRVEQEMEQLSLF